MKNNLLLESEGVFQKNYFSYDQWSPFLLVIIFFILGIVCAQIMQSYGGFDKWSLWIIFIYGLCLFLAINLIRSMESNFLISLFIFCIYFCAGVLLFWKSGIYATDDMKNHDSLFLYKTVQVKGRVVSDVTYKNLGYTGRSQFMLDVNSITIEKNFYPLKGRILVNVFRSENIYYGDDLLLSGKLHRPFLENNQKTSYRQYLKNKGIDYILSVAKEGEVQIKVDKDLLKIDVQSSLFKIRNYCKNVFEKYLYSYDYGIMRAVLLGDRSGISNSIKELFVRTGTVHIMAISGMHVSIVACCIVFICRLFRIHGWNQFFIVGSFLCSYVIISGMRVSVIRATVMFMICLGGIVFEKQSQSLNSLSLAAFIILMMNPNNLFDIGFQLSFLCVLSLIVINPWMMFIYKKYFLSKNTVMNFISNLCIASFSILVGVQGCLAYYFEAISLVSVLANLFVIPLMSCTLILGVSLLIADLIHPFIATCFAICLKGVLNILLYTVYYLSKIPYGYLKLNFDRCEVMAYYIILSVLCYLVYRRR